MANPRLTGRLREIHHRLAAIDGRVRAMDSVAAADRSREALRALEPLDGIERTAIEEYEKDWLGRYTYNSNAIEGSTLSLKDTELVLEGEFIPVDGPARYVFAARGVADGMAVAKRLAKDRVPLDIGMIQRLHLITALDVQPVMRGMFRPYGMDVRIRGAGVKTADPLEIIEDLELLVDGIGRSHAHPLLKAAAFHAMFENIHPFADGNGRTGRQLLNLMLMESGYAPIAIKHDAGRSYASTLAAWQTEDDDPYPLIDAIAGLADAEQTARATLIETIRNGAPHQTPHMDGGTGIETAATHDGLEPATIPSDWSMTRPADGPHTETSSPAL